MQPKVLTLALLAIGLPTLSLAAPATTPSNLKEVIQQAVLHSPEVTTRWQNYKAAGEEVGVARGGLMPRVDFSASAGHTNLRQPPSKTYDDFTNGGFGLSLNQLIFDGFATQNEVRRLDKARQVRYFELLDASENIALEAARAYIDARRYRRLVSLAEDNYVQHKTTHEQLLRRTQAGVGRRVDLEQAGSRLALAEINLTTEIANLHDVTARYQRLINSQPPRDTEAPGEFLDALPADRQQAIQTLYARNPALHAALANIDAASFEVEAQRGRYMPKLEFRARTTFDNNYQGSDRSREESAAEVVLNWNLLNGGADAARERQTIEKRHLALDMREKACRDSRQTLAIAYNDVERLRQQLEYMNTQVKLLENTSRAYREQFNVGQRSLLDLLDTENELFSARRSATGAEADLAIASLRTQAAMGTLLQYLGLQRIDGDSTPAVMAENTDQGALCPAEVITVAVTDRAELDARASAQLNGKVAVASSPLTGDPASGELTGIVQAWAGAWSARDYAAYMRFYAPGFLPEGGLSREDWAQLRYNRITGNRRINVGVSNIRVTMEGNNQARVSFVQSYSADRYSDTTTKTLELQRLNGKWLITREGSQAAM